MEKEYLNPPHPEVTKRVSSRLEELGIHYDHEMIAVVVAAYEDQLRSSFEMKGYLAGMLGFEWRQGESDKEYIFYDNHGNTAGSAKGEDITHMHGVIYKSDFVNPKMVREKQIELEGCDACGILSHCTKIVRNRRNDNLERLCNHCLVFDDQLRSEGDMSMCEGCTKMSCEHHPGDKRMLA